SPLILQLVEVVLHIAPVPVMLRNGSHLIRQRGHQHCVLILDSLISQFRKIQGHLLGRFSFGLLLTHSFDFGRRFAPQRPPQHHHPPRLGPSSQLQHVLSPLPSLPRIHPVLFAENLSDELLHIPALLELEHVPQPPRLGSHHGFLRSPMAVPAQEYGPVLIRSSVQECPQFRLCIRRSRLVSSLYLHVQHHPDIGYEVTMIGVRRASRLSRVISHLGVLLMSVQWLHSAIHI